MGKLPKCPAPLLTPGSAQFTVTRSAVNLKVYIFGRNACVFIYSVNIKNTFSRVRCEGFLFFFFFLF